MNLYRFILFVTLIGFVYQLQALTTEEEKLFKVLAQPKISQQDNNEVDKLLRSGKVNINVQEKGEYIAGTLRGFGQTPLMMASRMGHTALVRNLFNYGANPNIQMDSGDTALCLAANENQKKTVQALLDPQFPHIPRPNVNIQCYKGNTALNLVLLKLHKAEEKQLGKTYENLYHYKEIVKILLMYGADGSIKNDEGKTALDIALEKGYPKIFQMILDNQKKLKEKFEAEIAPLEELAIDAKLASNYLNVISSKPGPMKSLGKALMDQVKKKYEKALGSYLNKKYGNNRN